ncbi:MAG: hypothetical protein ABIV26_00675 [Candidatus Limnocylindrales bacterium]
MTGRRGHWAGSTGAVLALSISAAMLLAGCLTDAGSASLAPTGSAAPDATPTVTSFHLDTTVWYAGIAIEFGTAIASLDAKGGPVTVTLALQNLGAEDASIEGPIRLAAGDQSVEPARETVIPTVPAGTRIATKIAFEVGPGFDFAAAAIRVGRSSEHQAVVPLLKAGSPIVPQTLEPITASLAAKVVAGALSVVIHRAELRADLPDWHQEMPREVLALTLTYDATFTGSFSGGLPFTSDSVSLRLPDGRTVQPRRDGHSQSLIVIGPGVKAPALQSRFEVGPPGGGTYTLFVSDGATKKSVAFELTIP